MIRKCEHVHKQLVEKETKFKMFKIKHLTHRIIGLAITIAMQYHTGNKGRIETYRMNARDA